MWQLLALAVVGVIKAIDFLSEPSGPSGPSQPEPSPDWQKTQSVNGYYRQDGTFVRSYDRRPPR